jgi:hypothetical protein
MSSLIQIAFHTSYNEWLPMHKAIKQKKHSMQIHLRAKISEQMHSTESKSHNGENLCSSACSEPISFPSAPLVLPSWAHVF